MKAKLTLRTGIILLCISVMFATGCGKKVQDLTISRNGVPFRVVVDLPREMKHAESDSAVLKESAVVVSVAVNEHFYLGSEPLPKEELGERITRLWEGQPAANRIVYFAGGVPLEYSDVVEFLNIARMQGVNSVALLVERESGKDAPRVFKIQIPAKPAVDEVLPLKPDPLTLLVSIGADMELKLNQEPMGDTTDTANLSKTLTQVFQQRQGHEKTVIIKARRSTRYGQVVRVIDAARGAGANPIILHIDDLDS